MTQQEINAIRAKYQYNPSTLVTGNATPSASSWNEDDFAALDGVSSPSSQNKTLGSKLAERGKTLVKEVTGQPIKDVLATADTSSAKDVALTGGEALLRGLQSPIRAAGAVGGAIGDVVGAGIEATGLDKPIAKVLSPVVNSEPVQTAVKTFNQLPTDTQDVLSSFGNALNIPAGGVAKNVATAGAKKTLQVAGDGANMALTKVLPTTEKAVANTEKGIMNLVENKKSLLNDFTKREGTGKNPVKMIAENPDYVVKVNPEAKTIDATDAIGNMKRDIGAFSEVRDSLLKTADETLPHIPTDSILNKALTVFSNKNYSTYLDAGENAVNGIVKKLEVLKKYNPDTVSRETLNDIRKGLDETINSFTDTKLQDKVRLDLRKVFQTTLEDSIPESGLLKNLNAHIGDIIDASEFATKKLNGTKVKGGGLTDLAMKTAGASTGALMAGTGGAMLGIPGAVGGYMLSNFLSKQLIKNAINNPFDRKVLESLRQAKPDIVKQAEQYIQNAKTGRAVAN